MREFISCPDQIDELLLVQVVGTVGLSGGLTDEMIFNAPDGHALLPALPTDAFPAQGARPWVGHHRLPLACMTANRGQRFKTCDDLN